MEYKQVIILRSDIDMSLGKKVSQACHASLEAYKLCDRKIKRLWEISGGKKVVLKAEKDKILDIKKSLEVEQICHYLVKDRGLTEIPEGTITALGIGPDLSEKIDRFTKGLKLL